MGYKSGMQIIIEEENRNHAKAMKRFVDCLDDAQRVDFIDALKEQALADYERFKVPMEEFMKRFGSMPPTK